MKLLKLLPFILLVISACSKSATPGTEDELSTSTNKVSTSTNKGNNPSALYEEAKKYTEFACVVNNCAGTVCEGSKGSCKAQACTAIPDACVRIALTTAEIEIIATKHAQKMVADGNIDAKDFDKSKNLVVGILKNR